MFVPSTAGREGYRRIHGYRLFYRVLGPRNPRATVVLLHGGPGATHDYLAPFEDLTRSGYRVVFYDQLGCGRSDLARTTSEYSVERDRRDLESLRRSLRLGRVHLVGSSYGGLLAIAYALAHPGALKSLVSVSGLADVPLTIREMGRLKRKLPARVRAALARYEAKQEFDHPAYLAAVEEFYRRHLCRLPRLPPPLGYSFEHISRPKYLTMNGPNEFTIVGTIRDLDMTDRLHEIGVPTLVTAGRYDEVTPRVARSIHTHIPGSEMVVFSRSSHVAFWEERARFFAVLCDFLDRHS